MKTKPKKKQDYVAEVELSSDKLIYTFTELLKQKHGLGTKRVIDSTNQFLSEDPKHSFRKAVVETIPAAMKWRVEELSSTQCRINMYFPLPLWLRIRCYLAFISLGFLFIVAACTICQAIYYTDLQIMLPSS
jgi:hypothetical protein